ncbi:hypothetical protein KCP76_11865 [Salmonella enterica subsp. enterica serovar Weltevreden]|nr:hypothetical protein KCP76_11865 [Salmonella enterica subsp. enterica serovar Weltevreden]
MFELSGMIFFINTYRMPCRASLSRKYRFRSYAGTLVNRVFRACTCRYSLAV